MHFLHRLAALVISIGAVIGTSWISLSSGKMGGVAAAMISLLMLILMLMIMAFSLTKPADRQQTTRTSGVALTLLSGRLVLFGAFCADEVHLRICARGGSAPILHQGGGPVGTTLDVTDQVSKHIEADLLNPTPVPGDENASPLSSAARPAAAVEHGLRPR